MIKIIQHLYHIIYNKELYYASKYSSHSKLVHWDDPKGWTGEGGERGFRMENTCIPVADSCQCMAKTTTVL